MTRIPTINLARDGTARGLTDAFASNDFARHGFAFVAHEGALREPEIVRKCFAESRTILRLERRGEEARADGRRAGDRVHRARVRKVRPVEFERRRQ